MYVELIERKILTGINDEDCWSITQEGFRILPESDVDMEELIEMLETHFPDPDNEPYICDDCNAILEKEKHRFDPNLN